mgnify:CR=1 FL=1
MKEKVDLISFAVQKTLDFMTISLNEEYHFGKERLTKLADMVNGLWEEYDRMARSGGYEYADEKIRQRIKQIMG